MGKCLYCQLENQDKVFARHGFEADYCSKHKDMPVSNGNSLDGIDDGIDLNAEADEINREIDEERRKEYLYMRFKMPCGGEG